MHPVQIPQNGDLSRSHGGSRVTSYSPDGYASGNPDTSGIFSMHAPLPQQHHHHHSLSFQQRPQKQQSQETDLDDSGIGMSLMDDDLAGKAFGVAGPHIGKNGMVAGGVPVDPL